MTPERLTRIAIGVTIAVLAALFAVLFFESDSDATQRCLDKGYSAEECGWR
jgi:hypothetical protein